MPQPPSRYGEERVFHVIMEAQRDERVDLQPRLLAWHEIAQMEQLRQGPNLQAILLQEHLRMIDLAGPPLFPIPVQANFLQTPYIHIDETNPFDQVYLVGGEFLYLQVSYRPLLPRTQEDVSDSTNLLQKNFELRSKSEPFQTVISSSNGDSLPRWEPDQPPLVCWSGFTHVRLHLLATQFHQFWQTRSYWHWLRSFLNSLCIRSPMHLTVNIYTNFLQHGLLLDCPMSYLQWTNCPSPHRSHWRNRLAPRDLSFMCSRMDCRWSSNWFADLKSH